MVLAHAVLATLRDGPKHGYAIRRALEERIGLLSAVNQGQVYATLARLARAGLVAIAEPEAGRRCSDPGRVYEITRAGERWLAATVGRPTPAEAGRSELLAKIGIAIEIGDESLLRRLLETQRRACAERLAANRIYRDALPAAARRDAGAIARDAFLALLEADVAWLDAALAQLVPPPAARA
jgi:DNA-binding PadR family transcriptional regulator